METKLYTQSDQLQSLIDWDAIMPLSRNAGGHDEQMIALFKDKVLIAHWNEGDYQGTVATCIKFTDGIFKDKVVIYNDSYGSCSGCDSWDGADDESVVNMCKGLSNSAYIFNSLDDVKAFLSSGLEDNFHWTWSNANGNLLDAINNANLNS